MADNERIGGLEWEASIETDTFEQSVKRLNEMIEATDKPVKKVEKALKDTETQAKKTSTVFDGLTKRFTAANIIANVAVGAFTRITNAIGNFIRGTIRASSDLQELDSKARIVYGDSFPKVQVQVKAIADEVGRASSAILQMSTDMGAIISSFGIAGPLMEQMSTQLAKLAIDMASFTNATDEEAFNALRSGLTGETEPLKRFGIVLTDNNLQLFAAEKGLKNKVSAMNQAQKTALRYAFIMEKTALAQGDAARTADSFANQSRRLSGEIRTLQEELGKEATPVLASGLSALNTYLRDILLPSIRTVVQEFSSLLQLIGGSGYGQKVSSNFEKIFGGSPSQVFGLITGKSREISNSQRDLSLEDVQAAARAGRNTPDARSLVPGTNVLDQISALAGATGSSGGGSAESMAKRLLELEEDIFQALGEQADANKENLQTRRDELILRQKLGALTQDETRELDTINRRMEFSQDKIEGMVSKWEDLNDQIKDSRKKIEDYRTELQKLDTDTAGKRQDRIDELVQKRLELDAAARFGSLSVEQQMELADVLNELQGASTGELVSGERNAGMTELQRIDADATVEREKILNQIKTEMSTLEQLEKQGVKTQQEIVKALDTRQVQQDKTFALIEERQTEHVNKTIAEWNRLQAAISGTPISPIPAFASGGPVPGTGNTDSVHAKLMPGEHVITKSEVQNAGGHAAIFAIRRELARGLPRFAQGGPVTNNNQRSENYTIVNHGRAAEAFADPRTAKWLSRTRF